MKNDYSFKPYNDKEYQIYTLIAALLTIFPLFLDGEYKWYGWASWGVFVILVWAAAIKCILEYGTQITVTEKGIWINRGKHDIVPFTCWNAFESAYLLDVSWTDSDNTGFRKKRYSSYYLVLVKNKISDSEIQKLASRLAQGKPCGRLGGHVVFRLNEQHNSAIRQYIGEQIPLIEMKKNAEGEISRV